MNFAFGILIGRFMMWMIGKLMRFWWILVSLMGGSVVEQLLARVKVPQIIVILTTWITVAILMIYLRKKDK
jgi:hypothetical protein